MSNKTPRKKSTILRVSSYLFRYKGLFWLTITLAAAMTLLEIAVPLAVMDIIDGFQETSALEGLFKGVILIAALYIASEAFNCLRIRVNNTLEQRVLVEMRRDLHLKLLHLSVGFYDQRKSGEISSRVIEDVAQVERALLDGTEQGTRAILMIVGITAILFIKEPALAWCVFLPVPILIGIGSIYAKRSRVIWKGVRESSADLNSLLVEDIQGNRLIQSFGLQKRESGRFEVKADDLRYKTLRAMFRWSIYHPITNLVTKLGFLSIVGVGGYLILNNSSGFSMGKLVGFFLYANMLYMPISQIHGLNHLLAAGRASGERVFEILDTPIEVAEPQNPQYLAEGSIQIDFQKVSFKYNGRPSVIKDLNLHVAPKQVTAIVGHTGAGKSTIANLVMRTYDVTCGSLRLNGIDIRNLSLEQLHEKIGYVAQDPFLFEGSIRENLLLAKPSTSESELIKALEQACAWDFVCELPEKIDTNIGEKGIRLSQGEKQRLTIARVLLKNPPLVILDEATASVDTITERKIQQALDSLVRERTVLVIAHRMSTVRQASCIVVLDRGRIIESGTHESLINAGGHYAKLSQQQNEIITQKENLKAEI
ncbi:MAG: ABC transporter ATP-binding protein [Verrucomicrobiota bacterium]|nr:ABC transporter ATP-binding protein [Verrucomicrobiota bacterium]